MNKVQLYNNCFVVKGFSRDVVQNIVAARFYYIPKSMTYYLSIKSQNRLKEIPKQIKEEYNKFIVANNLGYYDDETKKYRNAKLNLDFEFPAHISNIVIYGSSINLIGERSINKLMVNSVLLIIDKEIPFLVLKNFFEMLPKTSVASVDIIIQNKDYLDLHSIRHEFEQNLQIVSVLVKSTENSKNIDDFGRIFNEFTGKIEYCKVFGENHFIGNRYFFFESQHHNTCLNRKLCIDKDGYVKNCPYMDQHYGHISETNIEEVIEKPEFQKWWHIKKDDIDVCKDCEFRHMCTDCRAFIKDPENIYSQPAKCTYNPYICKWEGEEGYVSVEECGTYSRETGFVPDKKRIEALNKEIWGDE